MNIQLADLKREYDLRTVWPNEAYDFTPWLENNLNLLGEAIGVDLCFREREIGRRQVQLGYIGF